ncbi:hypothetical protein VKT23_000274 [Stygiomarasmius scandens]|uniref:Uncharacterized protein n=1 Tax=Marasmiellus scandens TaxID=2682957 RepID=A0ABR1K4M9_9AGAR
MSLPDISSMDMTYLLASGRPAPYQPRSRVFGQHSETAMVRIVRNAHTRGVTSRFTGYRFARSESEPMHSINREDRERTILDLHHKLQQLNEAMSTKEGDCLDLSSVSDMVSALMEGGAFGTSDECQGDNEDGSLDDPVDDSRKQLPVEPRDSSDSGKEGLNVSILAMLLRYFTKNQMDKQ